jgi:hypothetical protein
MRDEKVPVASAKRRPNTDDLPQVRTVWHETDMTGLADEVDLEGKADIDHSRPEVRPISEVGRRQSVVVLLSTRAKTSSATSTGSDSSSNESM